MNLLKKITRHFISLSSALWVILNLGFWMFPLLFVALVKFLVPFKPIRKVCNHALEYLYRIAAWLDSFWMLTVVGIDVQVEGEITHHPSPIVVCNHQTWFDIPIIHHVITGNGQIVKFMIKRNLVWLPIVGWLCYALNFPRLHRGKGADAKKKDFAAIESATASMTDDRGALLIFSEGTRFTDKKRQDQRSPYQHLLIPRPGGLRISLDSVASDTPILDMTIIYEGGETNFWRCLGGHTKKIRVIITQYTAAEVTDPRRWLSERWLEKDSYIGVSSTRSA